MSMTSRPNRFFGGPRNTVQGPRPAQKPPKSDTSVLVHDCFDQKRGEKKTLRCGCKKRISQNKADDLVRRRRASWLVTKRYGRFERKRNSIVMRVNQRQKLPVILRPYAAKNSSHAKNIWVTKHGKRFHHHPERTDKLYWNTVFAQRGFGMQTGAHIEQADQGDGQFLSLAGFENFQMAPVKWNQDGETQWVDRQSIDPEVEEIILQTIDRTAHLHEQKGKVRCNGEIQHRGRGADAMEREDPSSDSADNNPDAQTRLTATFKPYSEKNVPGVEAALADDPEALRKYHEYLMEFKATLGRWEIDAKEPKEPDAIEEDEWEIKYDDAEEEIEPLVRPTKVDKNDMMFLTTLPTLTKQTSSLRCARYRRNSPKRGVRTPYSYGSSGLNLPTF